MPSSSRISPFKPFSVRKGFDVGENVVSLFEGWGVLSAANYKAGAWGADMDYPQKIKDIFASLNMFTPTAILSPPIADFVKARFNTLDEFEQWAAPAPALGFAKAKPKGAAEGDAPSAKPKMPFSMPQVNVIVAGGTNNNYYSIGGMSYSRSVLIDEWR